MERGIEFRNGSALEGLKVLDVGQVIAAPFAASILADLGADVIKIEMPDGGDNARQNLPMTDGVSTYFIQFNRSKRGVTLNMKKGREILLRMVAKADVIVENFRPGVMSRLGIDYEELKKVNPSIIMASISGFGQEGPYALKAGYDPLAQAMSGIMSVTGFPDTPPLRAGASIADIMAAQNAVIGILAALDHRRRTGQGQYIDVSLLDSALVGLASVMQVYLTDHSTVPARRGNGYAAGAPGGAYPTKDGSWVVTLALGDRAWKALVEVLDQPELLDDPRFITNQTRAENYEVLDEIVSAWTEQYDVDECVELLGAASLPAGPILSIDEVYRDAHIREWRQMFTTVDHPGIGNVEITNQAIHMTKTNPHVRSSAPTLGQHNDEVYSDLGFSEAEIDQLRTDGVI